MKELSPEDASVLALIAENPSVPSETVEELLSDVTDAEVHQIAEVLRGEDADDPRYSDVVKETADELKAWAERNRQVHSHSGLVRR